MKFIWSYFVFFIKHILHKLKKRKHGSQCAGCHHSEPEKHALPAKTDNKGGKRPNSHRKQVSAKAHPRSRLWLAESNHEKQDSINN